MRLVIRTEPNAVVVPREAVQTGQNGPLVFTITDGVAKVRPVVVDRTLRGLTVIKTGLNGDETVVTDGQLLLTMARASSSAEVAAGRQATRRSESASPRCPRLLREAGLRERQRLLPPAQRRSQPTARRPPPTADRKRQPDATKGAS